MKELRILTDEWVKKIFGDPAPFLNAEGRPGAKWEREILQFISLPAPLPLAWDRSILVKKIRCHKRIALWLKTALDQIYLVPSLWDTINDFAGCYEWRLSRKSRKLARHSWAIAIDLDACDNPFGRKPRVAPEIVDIFTKCGFVWGGTFPPQRIDGMHFEFADVERL